MIGWLLEPSFVTALVILGTVAKLCLQARARRRSEAEDAAHAYQARMATEAEEAQDAAWSAGYAKGWQDCGEAGP